MNNPSLSRQDRIEYIDFFRALGILSMIMGHVWFGELFDKWIHAFHMPMFFIISGYFFREQPIKKLITKRAKTLLLPYIFCGILHIAIYYIQIRSIDINAFYLLCWENTADKGIPIAGALWFLTALFFSDLIFSLVNKLKLPVFLKTVISFVIAITGMICATFLPFRLPFAIDVAMIGVGLFQIGLLIRERWQKIIDLNIVISIVGFVVFSILSIFNGYVNLREGSFGNWILFWTNAIGMTVSLWNISRCFFSWISGKKILTHFSTWITGIGKESIVYLCFNQLSILIAKNIISLVIPSGGSIMFLLKSMIILVLTMVELFIFQKVIMGTGIKKCMGR